MSLLTTLLNRLLTGTFGQILLGVWLAKDKWLCAELMWRAHRDQRARKLWSTRTYRRTVKRLEQFIRIDLSNTRRLRQIVAQHGWPGESLVRLPGTQAAWLLAQHADHDPAFQRHCLALLERAVQSRDAPAALWAYLTDRVRVAEGSPQVYGTQFHGALQPLPMEDEPRVDERRAGAGLPPLAEYVEQMRRANVGQLPWSEQNAEMKRLLSQLRPSNEKDFEAYVAQLKRFLDTTAIL